MQAGPPEEEVKLFEGSRERERYTNLADLFACITLIDKIDHIYTTGGITPDEYTRECKTLLGQYKTMAEALSLSDKIEDFMDEYRMECAMARKRIAIGVPITTEHGAGGAGKDQRNIFEVGELFITINDQFQMGAEDGLPVDEVLPLLRDLLSAINKISRLPSSFSKSEIVALLAELNGMAATDHLEEAKLRELALVLDQCHANFKNTLDSM